MKSVLRNNKLFLFGLILLPFCAISQKKSDQLQNEQKTLEKKLKTTKSLLEKVQKGTETSMSELKIIENQVKSREELVQNVDNQIRGAELSISSKDSQVKALQTRVQQLKNQYRKLVIYAYKHRNRFGKMMYIFSSPSYFEAVKRNSYLKRIAEIQLKQFKTIRKNEQTIRKEIGTIVTEKQRKEQLLTLKIEEKNLVVKDKLLKQKALDNLRKDESQLRAELQKTEREKEELKRRIKQAIEREIADAEAKAKKDAAKKESAKTTTKTESTAKTTVKKEVVFTDTKENIALGKGFESNRGKLPWPVLKGTITENYGKNPHPTISNVFTNNNGIDIGAPKNAQVRSVFEGEVTSVLNIPGAGKVVIIKHGNYRTVYSNLQESYVSVGEKVGTKQTIGALLQDDEGALSTSHFEIHQVVDGAVQRINPSLWLAQ